MVALATKWVLFPSILSSMKQGEPSAYSLMNRASVCSNTYRSKAQYAETALRHIYNILWLPLCKSCWENELSANSSASTWSLEFGQYFAHIKDSQASVWVQWKSGSLLLMVNLAGDGCDRELDSAGTLHRHLTILIRLFVGGCCCTVSREAGLRR